MLMCAKILMSGTDGNRTIHGAVVPDQPKNERPPRLEPQGLTSLMAFKNRRFLMRRGFGKALVFLIIIKPQNLKTHSLPTPVQLRNIYKKQCAFFNEYGSEH